MSDLEATVAELDRRAPGLRKAYAYYDGTQPEEFTDARLARLIARSSPSDRFNFARLVVSAVLDRLEIVSVAGPDDATTARLGSLWDANLLPLEANEFHRWALAYGHTFAIVWPNRAGQVRIHRNSPLSTLIAYDPEGPLTKLWAGKRWIVGAGNERRTRINLYYPDRIERWMSTGSQAVKQEHFARFDTPGQPAVVDNPYGQVPVFEFRPQLDGRPEHRDAFGPQGLINKLVATHRASVDYYGFPLRWIAGSDDDEDDARDDDGDDAPSKYRVGAGQLWKVAGEHAKVGQFTPADPEVYLKPIREYVKQMGTTTQTSMHRLIGADWPSGEALRAADTPEVKRAGDRLASLDWTWRLQLLPFALEADGGGAGAEVSVTWRPLEQYDDADKWEVVAAKIAAGMPVEEVLVEAGYDRELVQAWMVGPEPVG